MDMVQMLHVNIILSDVILTAPLETSDCETTTM